MDGRQSNLPPVSVWPCRCGPAGSAWRSRAHDVGRGSPHQGGTIHCRQTMSLSRYASAAGLLGLLALSACGRFERQPEHPAGGRKRVQRLPDQGRSAGKLGGDAGLVFGIGKGTRQRGQPGRRGARRQCLSVAWCARYACLHAARVGRPVRRRDHHRLVSAAVQQRRAVQGHGLHPGPAACAPTACVWRSSARCCRTASGRMRPSARRRRARSRTRCWRGRANCGRKPPASERAPGMARQP